MATTLGSTGITFPDATTQTTAATGGVTSLNGQTGAITNTTSGSIGSYVFALDSSYDANTNVGNKLIGTTVAGSVLVYANGNASYPVAYSSASATYTSVSGMGGVTNCGFSGTWRRMSKQSTAAAGVYGNTSYQPGLWVRIS